MFDSYKSAIVSHPASQEELDNILAKTSDAVLIGGCTHLMRYGNQKYPNRLSGTLVATDKIEKSNIFRKSNGFIEVGSNITLYKLCDVASAYLNPVLLEAINKTFAPSLQNRITIAGSIVPLKIFYDLCAPLIISSCIVEVKRRIHDTLSGFRLPIEDYFSLSEGDIKKTFISGVLIPVTDRDDEIDIRDDIRYLDFYKTHSSSYYNPENSVVIAGTLVYKNDIIDRVIIAVCYADKGVHNMLQTSVVMTDNVAVYLNSKSVNNMRKIFNDELTKFFDKDERNSISLTLFDKIIEEIQLKVL